MKPGKLDRGCHLWLLWLSVTFTLFMPFLALSSKTAPADAAYTWLLAGVAAILLQMNLPNGRPGVDEEETIPTL